MAGSSPVTAPAEPGRETLADLAAEAAGDAAQLAEAQAVEAATPPPPDAGLELTGACVALVAIAGGILCDRAGVEPLSQGEADGLGRALAGVAALYLPADAFDPVTARWLALAGAALAVVVPRLGQRRAAEVAAAPAPRPVVARPVADGPLPPGPLTA